MRCKDSLEKRNDFLNSRVLNKAYLTQAEAQAILAQAQIAAPDLASAYAVIPIANGWIVQGSS